MANKVILKDNDTGAQIYPVTDISNVLGKASNAQVEAGTNNVSFTTPLTVKHAIDIHAMAAIMPHINNKSNPHAVTAAQTGAYWSGNANKSDVPWSCSDLTANGFVRAKQDVIAYSAQTNVLIEPTGVGGSLNLWELTDVEIDENLRIDQILKWNGSAWINFALNDLPLSSSAVAELNKKVDKVSGYGLSQNDFTSTLKTKLDSVEANAQRNTITSVQGRTGAVTITKTDLELQNVDNTSDVNKPLSNATITELNKKFDKTGGEITGNVNVDGIITAKSDVVAYSTQTNVMIEPTATGVLNLYELNDVEIPSTVYNDQVLAYDSKLGKFTVKNSEGTGSQKISYSSLANVPTAFTPTDHSHDELIYTSDKRLKINVQDISNASIILNSLEPKTFNWNEKAQSFGLKDELSYGLIAQDVQELIPELVKPIHKDNYIGIDYVKLIPILIAGFKEQHVMLLKANQRIMKLEKQLRNN